MQDLTTKTLKELKAMAHQSFEKAYRLDIHYSGDKRVRQSWIDYLGRCYNAGLLGTKPESAPAVIDAGENSPGVATTLTDADRWNPPDFGEVPHKEEAGVDDGEFSGTDTEPAGADEIAIGAELPSGCDCCTKLHGTGGDHQNEGLGSQKGDRLLEESRNDSRGSGRILSHQPPKLTAFNDEQPPNRGDGRKSELAIGMLAGRRSDRRHIGEIQDIYLSKRGKLRAKIKPLNKSNFVYFNCENLIEQKLLYDYQMKPGGFIPAGSAFDRNRGEHFEVWTRKQPARKVAENWTIAELVAKPIWQLKAIAKRCCEIIPGGHPRTKRAYIRAILAEQELRAIALEKEPLAPKLEFDHSPLAQVAKLGSEPAKKQAGKRAQTAQPAPLGQQLSLNLFSVAS